LQKESPCANAVANPAKIPSRALWVKRSISVRMPLNFFAANCP
jgi:hypothetical protein